MIIGLYIKAIRPHFVTMTQPLNHTQGDDIDDNELEEKMQSIMSSVRCNPYFAVCLLQMSAWREFHSLNREEFKERVTLLDDRYARYAKYTDFIQISIIVLAAIAAFMQAGSAALSISSIWIQFVGLIISTYTGLVLSIAKYKKFDERKEEIHSLRHQCADFVTDIGARDDRLNTMCNEKMWATSMPNEYGVQPGMIEVWSAEHADMFNGIKPLINKKQTLVNSFEKVIDTNDLAELVVAAKAKQLATKKEKLDLDKQFLEHSKDTAEYLREKGKLYQKKKPKLSAEAAPRNFNMFQVMQNNQLQSGMSGMQYRLPPQSYSAPSPMSAPAAYQPYHPIPIPVAQPPPDVRPAPVSNQGSVQGSAQGSVQGSVQGSAQGSAQVSGRTSPIAGIKFGGGPPITVPLYKEDSGRDSPVGVELEVREPTDLARALGDETDDVIIETVESSLDDEVPAGAHTSEASDPDGNNSSSSAV